MAFHFYETVNLTQNAPRIEDEGFKAESGPPNNPINRTQAIRPSQVIGALCGPFGIRGCVAGPAVRRSGALVKVLPAGLIPDGGHLAPEVRQNPHLKAG